MDIEMLIDFTENRIRNLEVDLHSAKEYLKYLKEIKDGSPERAE